VKPGYSQISTRLFTCSSEIDIREPYASCAKRKRMPRLSVLVIEFVPDLIIVPPRGRAGCSPAFATKSGFCHSDQARYFAFIGLAGNEGEKFGVCRPGISETNRRFDVRK